MATVKKEDVIMVHKEDDQSTEEELEKLVFGDASSFRNNLKQFSAAQAGEIDEIDTTSESESDNHGQKDIELANDTDVGLSILIIHNTSTTDYDINLDILLRLWSWRSKCFSRK